MKFVLLADIHGSLPALQAVLTDLENVDVDGFIVAGDLIGGPHPNETLDTLRSLNARMILGNGEVGLLRYESGQAPAIWSTAHQFALHRWIHTLISSETYQFVRLLPEQIVIDLPGISPICVVHGTPGNPFKGIRPERNDGTLERILAQISATVLVCGHTHEPWVAHRNGQMAVNPGSVAGPLNGEVGAQYALLTWEQDHWQAELRLVKYDLDLVRQAFAQRGLLENGGMLAKCFLTSIETGRDASLEFLEYAYRLADAAGVSCENHIPNEIWDAAAASYPIIEVL